MKTAKRILLVGAPRTGSTWIAKYLHHSSSLTYYNHEPDNELTSLYAEYFKRNLPRFPYLTQNSTCQNYYNLFNKAFTNQLIPNNSAVNKVLMKYISESKYSKKENLKDLETATIRPNKLLKIAKNIFYKPKPTKENILVKSVHCGLALDFINYHFHPTIILVYRNPLDSYGSQVKLNMDDQNRKVHKLHPNMKKNISHIERQPDAYQSGIQMGLLYKEMYEFSMKGYKTLNLFYEDIIQSTDYLKILAQNIGIEVTQKMDIFLDKSNSKGFGYQTKRVLCNQKNTHQNILTEEQIIQFRNGYNAVNAPIYKSL